MGLYNWLEIITINIMKYTEKIASKIMHLVISFVMNNYTGYALFGLINHLQGR